MPDAHSALSVSERKQLRILKAVGDDPTMTGWWDRALCDRLVELGYAVQKEYHAGIKVACITEAGRRAADALDVTEEIR